MMLPCRGTDHRLEALNAHSWRFYVKHRMTVGTDGAKILDRINFVFLADRGKISKMMDMNEALSDLAVELKEIKTARHADNAILSNARLSCRWISFVSIDGHTVSRPLQELRWMSFVSRPRHKAGG
jgi:hypothetical protein